jgi:hypothetical protein
LSPRRFVAVALAIVAMLALSACPASHAPTPIEPPRRGVRDLEPEAAPAAGVPWRPLEGGRMIDREGGLVFELPDGWLVRSGEEPWVWEAKGPRWPAVVLRIGRWDGDLPALLDRSEVADQGWLSSGPYQELAELADGPPLVTSHEGDDMAHAGWYFRVDGVGVAIEAALPPVFFEEAWREVDEVVRSVEPWSER